MAINLHYKLHRTIQDCHLTLPIFVAIWTLMTLALIILQIPPPGSGSSFTCFPRTLMLILKRRITMTNPNKNELSSRTNLRNLISTANAGLHNAVTYPRKRYSLLALLLLGVVLCSAIYWPYHLPGALGNIFIVPAAFTYLCWIVFSFAVVGYVTGALDMQHNFARIGFVNNAGEAPYLILKEQHGNVVTYTYRCTGFPVSLWVDKQLELESALNMLIADVKEGKDRRTVTLCCVPPEHAFDTAEWHDRYIHYNEDNLLLLGRGLTSDITINIDKTPHILIGGNTGSGKTILLQCLLWQAIEQADVVYVADFKGGVDFPRAWQEFAYIITNEQKLLVLLNCLADTLEKRKQLFKEVEAANITEYRQKAGDYMQRIVFACDEVAELLDRTGADKERKELLAQIEARLALIARQGRAFGVHLILATQRPDANILPGQIKNNMNIRVCGRADTTLSTIIIGDGRAAEQIPHDAQGRFIMEDGTVFQAYYFNDATLK